MGVKLSGIFRGYTRIVSTGRMTGRIREGSGGFTLAEIMVVVAIIGLAVTLAVPSYIKMLPHLRLKAAARDATSAMQLARMTSISTNSNQTVSFNTNSDAFSYGNMSSEDWIDIDIYEDASSESGDAPSLTEKTGTFVKVTFKPDGTTKIPGLPAGNSQESLYLRNKNNPGERYRVRVVGSTGIIKLEKWNTSKNDWVRG